jgi:hypothetical protein
MKHGPSLAVRLTLYPLILVIFTIVSIIVIYLSAGYEFSYRDGHFTTQKTGIIIVATRPGEATIKIDGEEYEKKTSPIAFFKVKINRVKAGTHHLIVEKEGYETWEGDVVVDSGFVSWLDYLMLVPLEREAVAYNFAGSITDTVASRDQKRILSVAIDRKQGVYNIWFVNTENKTKEKIAESKISAQEKIDLLSISNNHARYLYKKTDKNGIATYIVAEAKQNGPSTNISALFNIKVDNYVFSPYKDSELYFVLASNLYSINLDTKTQSAILAQSVIGVYPNHKNMLIIQKAKENYGLWEIREDGDLSNIIKSLPAAKKYDVGYLEQQKIYTVLNLDDGDLITYGNDVKNPTLETIAREVKSFQISPSGEKIAYIAKDGGFAYDVKKQEYTTFLKDTAPKAIDWMLDSSNIIYRTPNGVGLVNYDGDYNKLLFVTNGDDLILANDVGHNIFFIDTIEADSDLYSFTL